MTKLNQKEYIVSFEDGYLSYYQDGAAVSTLTRAEKISCCVGNSGNIQVIRLIGIQ